MHGLSTVRALAEMIALFNMILRRKALAKERRRRLKVRVKAQKVEMGSNNDDNVQRRINRRHDKNQVLPVQKARAKRAKREVKERKAKPEATLCHTHPPPILVLRHEENRRPVEIINLLVISIYKTQACALTAHRAHSGTLHRASFIKLALARKVSNVNICTLKPMRIPPLPEATLRQNPGHQALQTHLLKHNQSQVLSPNHQVLRQEREVDLRKRKHGLQQRSLRTLNMAASVCTRQSINILALQAQLLFHQFSPRHRLFPLEATLSRKCSRRLKR